MENTTNITQIIINTINTLFENLFSSINNNLYYILDDITFISSDIMNDNSFRNIFGTSTTSGLLLISNSLLLGFILYYSINYLLAHFTYSPIESPINFIFKLLLCGLSMNFSFYIMNFILSLNSNISLSIRNLGELLLNKNICFSELITIINNKMSIGTNSIDIFSLDGLIQGSLTISLLNLIFTYSFRFILVKIFILLSPFAFLSLATSSTKWFFKSWIKNLFSLLLIQNIVSLILLLLFSMDYDSSLFSKFIYIAGIYSLIKANSFVREFIGGISTDVTQFVNKFSKFSI